MNVLLTSVGRRSYLVDYFKEALDGKGLVFGANSEANTSGMHSVDRAFVVPSVNSNDYVSTIIKICEQNEVKLVISLFDIDLPFLAAEKKQFSDLGIVLAVSSPEVIEIANDKWRTYEFLLKNNIQTPKTYVSIVDFKKELQDSSIEFPVIVKPRWGMGSLSVFKASSLEEVEFFVKFIKKQIVESYLNILSSSQINESVLIQEFISGDEFGIDVFNDLKGKHLATIVKKKLEMRSGETDSAVVVKSDKVELVAKTVGKALGHVGNLDMDILVNPTDGLPMVLEFNARFGGGYPFSHLAGVNFPKLLVQMAGKEELNTDLLSYQTGHVFLKYIVVKSIDSLCTVK